jgi:UMF1 family MFS transporter
MYDWANPVYSLTITSAIFPVYYTNVTQTEGFGDVVNFFGFDIINSVLYSYALSFSFLMVALMLPLLSGIADYGGKKKGFMKFFAYMGGLSCIGLFFFTGENIELGIILSVTASIGYSGSLVFYNSYLPEIVSPDRLDAVSARGFSFGYIGSVFLLILNLVMVTIPETFGMTDGGQAARISFLTVGIWWIGFSQITFARLPKNIHKRTSEGSYITKGYEEIRKVISSLKSLPDLKKYLLSFFFYNTGVQTVMYLAVLFGSKELTDMSDSELILTLLIIQIVAIAGSMLFAKLSTKKGNKYALVTLILIWICVCLAAFLVYNKYEFFALAFVVGMVMGGIQALSRATYSKLIPSGSVDTASYFSFYDVTYNVSIVVGTFAYGFVEYLTGSMRNSSLTLGFFFLVGLIILRSVTIPRTNTVN